jgi:hypothetical protein
MWEPRRLTDLWASKACYGDSFTISYLIYFAPIIIRNLGARDENRQGENSCYSSRMKQVGNWQNLRCSGPLDYTSGKMLTFNICKLMVACVNEGEVAS